METNNDITERKRSEDDLHKAQGELEHVTRVATLGQLTASIAHEVNQPLAAVVTNGEACLRWLRRAEPDIVEAQEAVERMIANGRRASNVIARLRALSRRADPHYTPVQLNEITEDALALMEWELDQRRVEIQLQLAPDLPDAMGDRVQLQQVIINLVMNAAQAMETVADKRSLRISSRVGRDDAGGRVVTVEVRDSGIGVKPTDLPHIFEAFHTSKPDGMGLGLSICRSIVEAHYGRIEGVPDADGGMIFRVTLPTAKELIS